MCPSMTLVSTLGNPRWSADAYLAESFASKVSYAVSGAIEKQINGLILAKDLWQLDGHLRKFLEGVSIPKLNSEPCLARSQLLPAKTIFVRR